MRGGGGGGFTAFGGGGTSSGGGGALFGEGEGGGVGWRDTVIWRGGHCGWRGGVKVMWWLLGVVDAAVLTSVKAREDLAHGQLSSGEALQWNAKMVKQQFKIE